MEYKDINSFSTIDYKRLQSILTEKGILQADLKVLLTCSQSSISQKLNGKIPITADEVKLIETTYGIKIPMKSESQSIVSEEKVKYKILPKEVFSEKACSFRLKQQVETYMDNNDITSRKYACEKLNLKYAHTTNVLNGKKVVTMEILRQVHLNGSFNLHYTLFNEDSMFMPKDGYLNRIKQLEEKVSELEKDKKNLQVLIDLLQVSEQSKAIA